MKIKRNIICLSFGFSLLLPPATFSQAVPAPTVADAILQSPQTNDRPIGRGEAVTKIVKTLGLEERKKEFLELCFNVPDECFFVFGAQSDFDGISFDPLVLYPDVPVANRFSHEINVATALGLVRGYPDKNTPFKPQGNLLRIHALKIVLEAQDLIDWKEKFELSLGLGEVREMLKNIPLDAWMMFNTGQEDVDTFWWCFRYIALGYETHLISDDLGIKSFSDFFEPIGTAELDALLKKAQFLYEDNKKTES